MPWIRCAYSNVSRPILRANLFENDIETLYETKSFQSITCFSLENVISTAKTLRVIDFTLTFYLEICQIPRLFLRPKFSRPIQRLFFRPNLLRPLPRLFFETKILETNTETFF